MGEAIVKLRTSVWAKVADFGTSRSVANAIGQTHLTTLVHGTFGVTSWDRLYKTSNGGQNYEEVEYVRTESIEPWDIVSSSTGTGPGLDCGPSSSLHEIPLLPFKS
ncbi:hypothetical protein L3X38_019094 [Prunus dulcis]|uniref:Uncharacterized protein n=1 Tax=Prunus dulcis TaxID=3755 RepID=A0AAD4WCH9_PRUDU|nr:hypothetical protein L3X38_019094 [Prunus dulcis]